MAAPSGANKRLMAEINRLTALGTGGDPSGMKFVLEKSPLAAGTGASTGQNLIVGRIFPNSNIYNQASYQVELKLPAEFPFKPPEVRFITQVYHPNVDEQGKICFDLVNANETWKPTTSLADVIKSVVDMIDHPKIDHALNPGKIFIFS